MAYTNEFVYDYALKEKYEIAAKKTKEKETVWIPKNPREIKGESREELEALIAELKENDDVENVFAETKT